MISIVKAREISDVMVKEAKKYNKEINAECLEELKDIYYKGYAPFYRSVKLTFDLMMLYPSQYSSDELADMYHYHNFVESNYRGMRADIKCFESILQEKQAKAVAN
ncbi:hypothetical protein [Peribacillus frigoritolerans]|uniref:hypothetical protein n=1 Tax=Peribacillus frigoritolerans TaxID=450367 RepID=UPI0025A08BE6|nr:hypothetical protein [Peribacillus frigoritolerans]MDM5313373.1 hypothetical protein [Peribacillus frigoritolerans]